MVGVWGRVVSCGTYPEMAYWPSSHKQKARITYVHPPCSVPQPFSHSIDLLPYRILAVHQPGTRAIPKCLQQPAARGDRLRRGKYPVCQLVATRGFHTIPYALSDCRCVENPCKIRWVLVLAAEAMHHGRAAVGLCALVIQVSGTRVVVGSESGGSGRQRLSGHNM